MEVVNIICYIITAIFIALVLLMYVFLPIVRNAANDKDIQEGRGEMQFFRFDYSGPVFIEHFTYERAANKFKGFKNDQRRIEKSYSKRPKRSQVKKLNNNKS